LNIFDGIFIHFLVSFESDRDRPVEESLENESAMIAFTFDLVAEFVSERGIHFKKKLKKIENTQLYTSLYKKK